MTTLGVNRPCLTHASTGSSFVFEAKGATSEIKSGRGRDSSCLSTCVAYFGSLTRAGEYHGVSECNRQLGGVHEQYVVDSGAIWVYYWSRQRPSGYYIKVFETMHGVYRC